jgi:arabinofuranosyltransferase
MIAGALSAGLEPILFTQIITTTSYIFTVGLLIFLSARLVRYNVSKRSLILPIAAVAILIQYDFHVWATSGLETAFVTALITSAYVLMVLNRSKKMYFLSGLILTAALLTRPDSMIFYLMGLVFIIIQSKGYRRGIIYYLAPMLLIYVPYWIWRYAYYGYPFPNTYYAKSTYMSWYSQGLIYLLTYMKTYYILCLLPLIIMAILPRLSIQLLTHRYLANGIDRAWLLGILFIVPYTFYVVRIGGDFMHARFFIPITPIAFFLLEMAIFSIAKENSTRILMGAILVILVFFRWDHFAGKGAIISGIIDERTFYPAEKIEQAKIDGARLKKYVKDSEIVIGFYGAKAMLMYYSEAPMAIECHAGLTDEYLAHQPLKERRRIGHEKSATDDYMAKRRVHFIAVETRPLSPQEVGVISFEGSTLPIKMYDNKIMNELKKYPEVEFVDFPEFLDDYIAGMEDIPEEQFLADFIRFKSYYFDFNDDPARLEPFLDRAKYFMERANNSG